MEESKKKPLMMAAIVICLIAAVAITFTRGSKDTGIKRFSGKLQWIKCTNPDCGAEYTMDKKEYFEWCEKPTTVSVDGTVGMVCKECGQETALAAIKCEKCDHVFFPDAAGADFSDTCPECGYSKIEEDRKKAHQAR